jgi:hypothetical protein
MVKLLKKNSKNFILKLILYGGIKKKTEMNSKMMKEKFLNAMNKLKKK